MKRIIIFILLGLSFTAACAQESLRISPMGGKKQYLRITTGDASVDFEGYDGDVLMVEPIKTPENVPALAKGLNRLPLHNEPLKDSIGYKILKNDSTYFDIWVSGTYKHLRIMIPNHRFAYVSVLASSSMPRSQISVKNITGNLDISATAEVLLVSHVTGPFTISGNTSKTILTDILWQQFPNNSNAYSIRSTQDLDITLAPDLKATITGGPLINGRLYSDLALIQHQDSVKNSVAHDPKYPGQYIRVMDMALNGGGIKIDIAATYGNIYLRKAK